MKKLAITGLALLCAIAGVFAQEENEGQKKSSKVPSTGNVSLAIRFNPIAAHKANEIVETDPGMFLGNTIMNVEDKSTNPNQMFFLSQDPMVSLQAKYHLSRRMAVRLNVGFSGGNINYREYVKDDAALANDPLSEQVVTDKINCKYTGGAASVGMEFNTDKALRFVGGFNIVYAWGGGKMSYEYGNRLTELNRVPTTMDKVTTINEFVPNSQMSYARPVEQYNIGVNHGVGISGDMGVEWYFIDHVSIGARVSILPVMWAFQPQTYSVYEGYNEITGAVQEYNSLVSEGSNYFLYGTNNISVSFSIGYTF